jgi:hypothetical protein
MERNLKITYEKTSYIQVRLSFKMTNTITDKQYQDILIDLGYEDGGPDNPFEYECLMEEIESKYPGEKLKKKTQLLFTHIVESMSEMYTNTPPGSQCIQEGKCIARVWKNTEKKTGNPCREFQCSKNKKHHLHFDFCKSHGDKFENGELSCGIITEKRPTLNEKHQKINWNDQKPINFIKS